MGSDEVIHSSDEEELSDILYIRPKKNNTLVSGDVGDEKNLHLGGRNFFELI